MGHDITAYDEADHEVAYLRRGAGNPLNQAIYLALGVMDEAYGGCSGYGRSFEFGDQELRDAIQILTSRDFSKIKRPRNVADDLVEMFGGTEASVVDMSTRERQDVAPEIEFCNKALNHLIESGEDAIRICFG